MRVRAALALIAVVMALPILSVNAQQTFAVIIVRGDIYPDWTVSMAYAHKIGSFVVQLFPGKNDREVLNLIEGLVRFNRNTTVLIVGDPMAVPDYFVDELEGIGVRCVRVGGLTRAETSINLASYYWKDAEGIVLVDGLKPELYLPALEESIETSSPIIYTMNGSLPKTMPELLKVLKKVKKVYVIGNSLNPQAENTLKALISGKASIIRISVGNATLPRIKTQKNLLALPLDLIAASMLSCASGAAAAYYISRRRSLVRRAAPDLLQFFSEDERRIISILLDEGEISQEKLAEITGYSRPKVSRVIAEMVDKKIVERRRRGRTYTLRLTEKFISTLGTQR